GGRRRTPRARAAARLAWRARRRRARGRRRCRRPPRGAARGSCPEPDAAEEAGLVGDHGHVRREALAIEVLGVAAAEVEAPVVEEGLHRPEGRADAPVPLAVAGGLAGGVAEVGLVLASLPVRVVPELDLPGPAVDVEAAAEAGAQGDHGLQALSLDDA